MKGTIKFFVLFLLCFLFCFVKNVKIKASVLEVDCDSYIVIEKESKRVLVGKNIDEKYLPASITKILTCITAIENGDLERYYKVTKEVERQEGSSIYLEEGEEVKLIDLLYGLMLRSGNDAAYLISISVCNSYDEFIKLMNKTALNIGMNNSVFKNSSGLDERECNYSTAYDMAILMAYALNNEVFRKITSTSIYTFKTLDGKVRSISNKHKLIKGYDYITGGKTGVGVNYGK